MGGWGVGGEREEENESYMWVYSLKRCTSRAWSGVEADSGELNPGLPLRGRDFMLEPFADVS